jgi:selenocysteine lyase/cysteine desulfurase
MRPVTPGWNAALEPLNSLYGPEIDLSPTASKLDTSLAWFAALGERAALRIFEQVGVQQIFEHNRDLVRRLRERMAGEGMSGQDADDEVRSTIISIPVKEPEAVLKRFREDRIVASVRAGRVRISLHFYNSPEDIDLVATLLHNRAGG